VPGDLLATLVAEIERARSTLADADRRELYDRRLCAELFPPAIKRPLPPTRPLRELELPAGHADTLPAAPVVHGEVFSQIMSLLGQPPTAERRRVE
jgi:hypothetical protein